MPMPAEAATAETLLFHGSRWAGKCYLNSAAEGLPLAAAIAAAGRYLDDK